MSEQLTTNDLNQFLRARMTQLQSLARVSGDRKEYAHSLKQAAIIQAGRNPSILRCTPRSILLALYEGARLGLDLDLSGSAYIVPYKNEAKLVIGYRGLIEIAMRSGNIRKIEAFIVNQEDHFDLHLGTDTGIEHWPCVDKDPGPPVGVYAVATYRDKEHQFIYMRWEEVMKIKRLSRASKGGPWDQFMEEMAKKTAIRRLCKMIPFKPLAQALYVEDCAESGERSPVEFVVEVPEDGATLAPVDANVIAIEAQKAAAHLEEVVNKAAPTQTKQLDLDAPDKAQGGRKKVTPKNDKIN